jgi:hypothetical protein
MQAYVTSTTALAAGHLANLEVAANREIVTGTTELPERYDYATVPQVNFVEVGAGFTPAVTIVSAAAPAAPVLDFSTVEDITTPDFDTATPTLAFPTAPSSALPTAPGAAPSFVSPDIPATPSVSLPAIPTFEALALPTAPSIDLPAFTSGLPTDDLTAPTAQFEFYEAAYESTLLDPLKAKLLADLTNGGYGIETADEIALFNRARDREVEAMLSRIEDAGRAMAARGFPLPPGELSLYVDDAYQQMQNKVSSASRDITLERARLYVDNRKFTIEQTREVEQILIGFHNSVQERALNVARLTVEMGVVVFKALVERYNARLNAYRAEAEAFANRIRGELAKAEIYRSMVEAVNVGVQMQRQQVEVYLAQLKGIEMSVDIFKVKMDAAKIHADIERTKLEAFRAQVDAYTAQVNSKVAEFGMFRAQIEGETAKVGAFEAQVRAFGGQVTAAKIKSDVQLGKLQSETEQARVKLATYQGQLEQYKADVERQVQSGRLQVDYYSAIVGEARMLQDGRIAKASLQQEAIKSTTQQNIDISRMTIENAKARINGVIESIRFKTAAAHFGSSAFFAQLTALTNAVNSLSVETVAS